MGQYHKLVNIDRGEYIAPHSLFIGAKQYEHTGYEGSLSDILYIALMTSPARGGGDFPLTELSGRWAGDRVVVLGDYTEDQDLPHVHKASELYLQTAHDNPKAFIDISDMAMDALRRIWPKHYERNSHDNNDRETN